MCLKEGTSFVIQFTPSVMLCDVMLTNHKKMTMSVCLSVCLSVREQRPTTMQIDNDLILQLYIALMEVSSSIIICCSILCLCSAVLDLVNEQQTDDRHR